MEYKKCLVEVDEVLGYLVEEDLNKIPIEVRQGIKNEKDKQYIWKYDETKNLNDQNLSREAIAILSYLNMEYMATKEQKELLEKMHEYNDKIRKDKTINLENDKNNKLEDVLSKNSNENKNMDDVEVRIIEKQTIFQKFIVKLKRFFNKK